MKGSRHIRISNRKLTYEFTIRRNLTIIRGDSATGKTTLIGMIREFNLQGEDSGVQISSSSPCVVVEGQNWEKQLRELDEDSVVFIDEGNRFVSSRRFAEVARASSNYYVIVTRENLYALPYSVTEIYGIHSAGKYNSIQKVYHEFYRIYGEKNNAGLEKVNEIITEDSNSGYQFFRASCRKDVSCRSAAGNSNVLGKVEKSGKNEVLVIADGAAFGPYMGQLDTYQKRHSNIHVFLPESFEWLILKSGLIASSEVKEILSHPEDFVESKVYFSWEQFFTACLQRLTNGTFLQYQKSLLNPVYLHPRETKALLETMPEQTRALFRRDV